jgi:hypothetical protein
MATKTDFTADEWAQLLKAPGWASIAVVAASPSGPLGVIKEMFAAGKILAETKVGGAQNPLVGALVNDLTTSEGRQRAQPSEVSGKSPEEVRAMAVAALERVAALLDGKAGADADGFKRWLTALAGRVAEASKEGGFLGVGGTRVSEKENATLSDIGKALGVTV